MKPILIFALVFGIVDIANAQQIMPSQMAIQIDNAVNGLATSVEVLQKQLAQSQAQVKELQDKYEPKKDPKPNK